MLKAESITVGYKNKAVLSSLTMVAEPGSITVLVGPNGSGKSTLLRCLAGALRPSSGRITISGKDLYRMSANRAAHEIAYVSQETAMPFAFTVGELVSLANRAGGGQAASKEAVAMLDLEMLEASALNSLSGGEQQRAAIARGLAQQTPYLLLDEPTAHLDLRYQAALFRMLRKRSRDSGSAIVVVLHDLTLAARCADNIILLNNGIVEKQGAVADVITEELLERVYRVPVTIRRQGSEIVAVAPADNLTFT